ncbi:GNAT family N-acetyltransferase [soil metagenome]
MTVREVTHGTPDYEALIDLRRRVLRQPLGLDFTPEELAAEADQKHFGLYQDGRLTAVCAAIPLQDGARKIRQVAVEPKEQGKGYGAALMKAVEERTAEIVLHARDTAVPFYLRLGYAIEGEPFEEVGIPHRRMRKRLGTLPDPVSS